MGYRFIIFATNGPEVQTRSTLNRQVCRMKGSGKFLSIDHSTSRIEANVLWVKWIKGLWNTSLNQ